MKTTDDGKAKVRVTVEDWAAECRKAADNIGAWGNEEYAGEMAIEESERLLAVARHVVGVACPKCRGLGQRAYSSTATWRGGIGGQAITADVCDQCWGTGRTDKTGIDLRRLRTRS